MQRVRKRDIAVFLIVLAIIGLALGRWWMTYSEATSAGSVDGISSEIEGGSQRVILPEIGQQAYKPLSETEAFVENAQLPFSNTPIEEARPYAMPDTPDMPFARRSAIECLTAAVYYEAGFEPTAGKRAVAQVVLNRARHPAFPNSVCAVVYQGSERRTGCQFTFTCDGSLTRQPAPSAWAAARQIATEALSGTVEPSVGMATHYHADYVVPYWASSLNKITKHGSHYFYRWKGNWGLRRAFTQAVVADALAPGMTPPGEGVDEEIGDLLATTTAVTEVVPPSNIFADDSAGSLIQRKLSPGLGVTGADVAQDGAASTETTSPSRIEADRSAGTLVVDERFGEIRQ